MCYYFKTAVAAQEIALQGNESSSDNEFIRSNLCLRVLATLIALADQCAVAVQHSP